MTWLDDKKYEIKDIIKDKTVAKRIKSEENLFDFCKELPLAIN